MCRQPWDGRRCNFLRVFAKGWCFPWRGRRIRNVFYRVVENDFRLKMHPRRRSRVLTSCSLSTVVRRIRLGAFGGSAGLVAVLVSGTGFWTAAATTVGRAPIKMETNEVGRNEVLRWGRTRSLIYSPSLPLCVTSSLSLSFFFFSQTLFVVLPYSLSLQHPPSSRRTSSSREKIQFSRARAYRDEYLSSMNCLINLTHVFNKE